MKTDFGLKRAEDFLSVFVSRYFVGVGIQIENDCYRGIDGDGVAVGVEFNVVHGVYGEIGRWGAGEMGSGGDGEQGR